MSAGIGDEVVADDVTLAGGGGRLGVGPAVDGPGIVGFSAGAADVVVLDDVAAHAAAAQVDAVVGRVVDRVVPDQVPFGEPGEHAGREVVDLAAAVDVVFDDLVIQGVLQVRVPQRELEIGGSTLPAASL